MKASKMEEPIIDVKHLSKQYSIGVDKTYKTLSGSLTSAIRNPLKMLKDSIKPNNVFWALKDVNFKVERGETLGIIGKNGAGKSTLLKILSRITYPTEGEVRMRGRVGSLLEVGTGFHPELSGRENIYFNGAILGMKKREIEEKFNEIVEFSGIDRFLDTPVKRYSSGMQVRLAFSVAAHLDPEILIVDEVLAVGDVAFQKKCIKKMNEVAEGGRTVLFVSHNIGAIKSFCSRGILLDKGKTRLIGNIDTVTNAYLDIEASIKGLASFDVELGNTPAKFKSVSVRDAVTNEILNHVSFSKSFIIEFEIISDKKRTLVVGFSINNAEGQIITTIHSDENFILNNSNQSNENISITQGLNIIRCQVKQNFFRPGIYTLNCSLFSRELITNYDYKEHALLFEISNDSRNEYFDDRQQGLVFFRENVWEKTSKNGE